MVQSESEAREYLRSLEQRESRLLEEREALSRAFESAGWGSQRRVQLQRESEELEYLLENVVYEMEQLQDTVDDLGLGIEIESQTLGGPVRLGE